MGFKHFIILILEVITVIGVLDVSGIYAFDELIVVGYLLIYFIVAVALFILSTTGLKKDSGYLHVLDIIGITISIGSILLAAGHFASVYFAQ